MERWMDGWMKEVGLRNSLLVPLRQKETHFITFVQEGNSMKVFFLPKTTFLPSPSPLTLLRGKGKKFVIQLRAQIALSFEQIAILLKQIVNSLSPSHSYPFFLFPFLHFLQILLTLLPADMLLLSLKKLEEIWSRRWSLRHYIMEVITIFITNRTVSSRNIPRINMTWDLIQKWNRNISCFKRHDPEWEAYTGKREELKGIGSGKWMVEVVKLKG